LDYNIGKIAISNEENRGRQEYIQNASISDVKAIEYKLLSS